MFVIKEIWNLKIPTFSNEASWPKVVTLIVVALALYLNNRYFLSNREKRNKIIDNFRELDNSQKIIWKVIALILMFTPVWFILWIYFTKYF
jgi:hypothetical protein